MICTSGQISFKSRRMRWAGHLALMGERRGLYWLWWGDLRERRHRRHCNVIIILKCTCKEWDEEPCTGMIGLRIGTSGERL